MTILVRRAGVEDLDALAPLFDDYRRFYRQPADPGRARAFLAERLERGEAVVFLALDGGRPVGFTLLYPSFSSVSAGPILVLNDLYVAEDARRLGAGSALLGRAVDYGREVGAVRLSLTTEWNNSVAQSAYERCGWTADNDFKTYNFSL